MHDGRCHCGKVAFRFDAEPEYLVACNCSLCSRLAPLWAYAPIRKVELIVQPEDLESYIQGDHTLALHRCRHCGCATHWLPLDPEPESRMAVNFRMCPQAILSVIPVRQLDGADTWTYLDG